jgi:hypothetical protein
MAGRKDKNKDKKGKALSIVWRRHEAYWEISVDVCI